jgi:RimJ/RimL family protein N-acetyltransferase
VSFILLEPFDATHLEALAPLIDDPDVQRFTRIPVPTPVDFARTWLKIYEEGRRDGRREAFAILDATDGSFLGLALAPRIDRTARTVELGYMVAPHARGRGVATEALRLLTDWSLTTLGALRIELLISPKNEPSRRAAIRCGYVREGLLRSLHVKEGVREDTEIWSHLPGDEPSA